jgi:hypothetical protein
MPARAADQNPYALRISQPFNIGTLISARGRSSGACVRSSPSVVGGEFNQRARLSRHPALLCQLRAKTLEPLGSSMMRVPRPLIRPYASPRTLRGVLVLDAGPPLAAPAGSLRPRRALRTSAGTEVSNECHSSGPSKEVRTALGRPISAAAATGRNSRGSA